MCASRSALFPALVAVALLSACTAAPVAETTPSEPRAADGFGPVTMVTLEPGVYRVATDHDTSQPDLVVEGGSYPVRRVASDQVSRGPSQVVVTLLDGTHEVLPAPPSFATLPTVRVGGTEMKRVAVLAALSFCGLPAPDAEDLYLWGDEPVSRAGDTGEWQFTDMC